MASIRYEITVDRPPSEVWDLISDFGGVYRYNPNVSHSRLTNGSANEGVGATRHCDLSFSGASVEERILEWHEGAGYALEIFDGEKLPPFRSGVRAAVTVRPAGSERSVVAGSMDYELKFGPVGRLMDRAMVAPRFGPAFGRFLAGIKHHAETGEEITENTDLSAELAALHTNGATSPTRPAAQATAR